MAPRTHLDKVNLLVADGDVQMGKMLTQILHYMSFPHVRYVSNGEEALHVLKHQEVDFLITDWQMPSLNGIALTTELRKKKNDTALLTLPIIMLTARSERRDVETARDAGVTEFALKPYSAKSLYDRLQRMVDTPRDFILAENFNGPDRRHKSVDTGPDRRITTPEPIIRSSIKDDADRPRVLYPDYELKKKMGITGNLGNIITPALLTETQKIIPRLQGEAFGWIVGDVDLLGQTYNELRSHQDIAALERFIDLTLAIKSRAGTFGYGAAANVAMLLYQFLRNDYIPGDHQHNIVLLKHVQALKAILAAGNAGIERMLEMELFNDLQALIRKYKQGPG